MHRVASLEAGVGGEKRCGCQHRTARDDKRFREHANDVEDDLMREASSTCTVIHVQDFLQQLHIDRGRQVLSAKFCYDSLTGRAVLVLFAERVDEDVRVNEFQCLE